MKIKHLSLVLIIFMLFTACQREETIMDGTESSIYDVNDVQKIKIVDPQAQIRSGCSPTADALQTAQKNDTYTVLNKVQDWYAVQLPDNNIGFVPQQQSQPVIDESQPVKTPPVAQRTPQQQNKPQPSGPDAEAGDATNAKGEDTELNSNGNTNKAGKDNANNASSMTAAEQEMLDLVNKERSANNLQPLQGDLEVTKVARIKSQDMIDNNYFSHNSPTYGSPFDMLKSFGVHYIAAGENLAGNQSVTAAHNALMNSPGHKANILKPEYTHVGIGIIEGGNYGMMFTQMFTNKSK